MSSQAFITMIFILTFIVGGFAFFLSLVMKNESKNIKQ